MPDNGRPQNVTVTIDGTPVSVPKGTLLVEAAKQIQREIPVYCYHTKMGPAGLCRICLVEIEGTPKLQIGCNTACTDGMVVHTQSANAAEGRRAVLEFYLKNHPLDCPICDKGGECDLQDYAMAYGQDHSRSADPKVPKPKAIDLGPTIVLDEERCVVCQRCVRFDDIIVGERQLVLKDRGVRNIIATATGEPYRHEFTGNVTELCPVGALTSKTFRFKSRPWDLRRTTTSCTQCPVGCQMHVDVRVGKVMRTMSVASDDAISDGWLCDRGRYNIGFYDDQRRITQPLFKQNGQWVQIGWDDALQLWATALNEAASVNPAGIGVIGGGRLTNEEAFLLQHVFRSKGIRNIDWRSGRQRQASPGRSAGTLSGLESADAIFIAGESPAQRAPVIDLRVRKAAFRRGARLIRIASLESPYPPPIGAVDVGSAREGVSALPPDSKRVAIVWDGTDVDAVRELLAHLGERFEIASYITGEQANARGAEAMGVLPHFGPGFAPVEPGFDTQAMLEAAAQGRMAVLSIFGANPALQFPNGPLVQEALEKVPFVALSELFMTQTAQLATLILPAKGAFEKVGTVLNMTGDVLAVNAAHSLQTPGTVLSDLEMLIGLAQSLHVDVPSLEHVDAAVRSNAAATAPFTLGDERFGSGPGPVSGAETDGTLRVTVQTRIFSGGGTCAHDEPIADLRPLPQAALSPADAQRLGARTGDYVDLRAARSAGAASTMHDLLVEVRAAIPAGMVGLIAGLPDDPANLFAEASRVEIVNVRKAGAAVVGTPR